jgi:hypothetical protein
VQRTPLWANSDILHCGKQSHFLSIKLQQQMVTDPQGKIPNDCLLGDIEVGSA